MKKIVKATGIGIGILGIFSAGILTKAATDWKSNAINSAYNDLLTTASGTTNELTTDVATDINVKIQTEIAGSVDSQQKELERLLEEYYQMKLNSLTNTEEFRSLEEQIKIIKNNVLEAYKSQIDEAFASQNGK